MDEGQCGEAGGSSPIIEPLQASYVSNILMVMVLRIKVLSFPMKGTG
jgi:hypothetical protein